MTSETQTPEERAAKLWIEGGTFDSVRSSIAIAIRAAESAAFARGRAAGIEEAAKKLDASWSYLQASDVRSLLAPPAPEAAGTQVSSGDATKAWNEFYGKPVEPSKVRALSDEQEDRVRIVARQEAVSCTITGTDRLEAKLAKLEKRVEETVDALIEARTQIALRLDALERDLDREGMSELLIRIEGHSKSIAALERAGKAAAWVTAEEALKAQQDLREEELEAARKKAADEVFEKKRRALNAEDSRAMIFGPLPAPASSARDAENAQPEYVLPSGAGVYLSEADVAERTRKREQGARDANHSTLDALYARAKARDDAAFAERDRSSARDAVVDAAREYYNDQSGSPETYKRFQDAIHALQRAEQKDKAK